MTGDDDGFDPGTFLPYLLNQAAETTGEGFRQVYRDRYGMLRTEWRVLFHLGHYGDMTARQICDRASLHKTKVSRAVAKLEARRFLSRHILPQDRRNERLTLTPQGRAAFDDLQAIAAAFNDRIRAHLGATRFDKLTETLRQLAADDGC